MNNLDIKLAWALGNLKAQLRPLTGEALKTKLDALLRTGQVGCVLMAGTIADLHKLTVQKEVYLQGYYSKVSCVN